MANPACAYRFDLFPWLNEQIAENRVKTLLILGDLTDAKDNHSAELVNKIVTSITSLKVPNIRIIAGNHDWLKKDQEFFKFLNALPNVKFITSPTEDDDTAGPLAYYLPYSKNPTKDWQGKDFSHYDYLFMHQTVSGSIASNGQEMEGEDLPALNAGKVYSGDIHVPQTIKGVEYVGSPYHVHFGDDFKPRCVLIEKDRRAYDLHFETISRTVVKVRSLRELRSKKFKVGDQVKLRIELPESDKHGWSKIRREALEILADKEVSVHGVELIVIKANKRAEVGGRQERVSFSPSESVVRFVEREELGADALDAALEIIEP